VVPSAFRTMAWVPEVSLSATDWLLEPPWSKIGSAPWSTVPWVKGTLPAGNTGPWMLDTSSGDGMPPSRCIPMVPGGMEQDTSVLGCWRQFRNAGFRGAASGASGPCAASGRLSRAAPDRSRNPVRLDPMTPRPVAPRGNHIVLINFKNNILSRRGIKKMTNVQNLFMT
jgi:hypothetical protein